MCFVHLQNTKRSIQRPLIVEDSVLTVGADIDNPRAAGLGATGLMMLEVRFVIENSSR